MTVTFSPAPSAEPTRPELGDLLWPQIRSKHGSPVARDLVLRCLVRALRHYPPRAVRAFLRTGCADAPDVQRAVASDPEFAALVAEARRHVARSSSPARDRRVLVARRLLGWLAAPKPEGVRVSQRGYAQALIALTVMAVQQMKLIGTGDGYDRILCSAPWLAAELNVEPQAASRTLKAMRRLGMIRPVGSRGRALYYRLGRLDRKELRSAAWANGAVVDALADWDGETGLDDCYAAALIAAVSAPAWAYDPDLGLRAWLRAVGAHLVYCGSDLGIGITSMRELARMLERELPGVLAGEVDLGGTLRERGEAGLAEFVKADVVEAHKERARETAKQLAAVRAAKTEKWEDTTFCRTVLRKLYSEAGRVPDSDADRAELERWVSAMARAQAGANGFHDAGLVATGREQLAGLLQTRGWDNVVIEKAVAFIFPAGAEVAA